MAIISSDLAQWTSVLGDVSSRKAYAAALAAFEQRNQAFLSLDIERGQALCAAAKNASSSPLSGLPFAVKDNIAVAGFPLTCGSKMLENLVAPYTATAVERLLAAGAAPVGKTNLDEFGMGSSTDNSALARTSNPWDLSRVAGGSSGGSAAAVAEGLVPFALGSDTGGSVRQPAAFCGVYGLKPTYGAVSRFGLVAYASSLEAVGVLARDVDLCEAVFAAIRGEDARDHSSLPYAPGPAKPVKRIGILANLSEGGESALDAATRSVYDRTLSEFRRLGYELVSVALPHFEYTVPVYYTIATAEASANLDRYDGIRYGFRVPYSENHDELVRKSRDAGLGDEVKLRILLGTFVLRSGFQDQYYIRAQKIRTAIRADYEAAFQAADALLMPVFPTPAFKHGDATDGDPDAMSPFRQKLADQFTCSANLAGLPALSFPAGVENGLPVGLQLVAPAFEEGRLFETARAYAKVFPCPRAPLFLDPNTIGNRG